MSISQSGNRVFDAAVNAAESAHQSALRVPGIAQSDATTADIAFLSLCLGSAISNGIDPTIFAEALTELGVVVQLPAQT